MLLLPILLPLSLADSFRHGSAAALHPYVIPLSRSMLSESMNKVDVYMGVLRCCVAGDTAYSLSDVRGPLGPNQVMFTLSGVCIISVVFTAQVRVVLSP